MKLNYKMKVVFKLKMNLHFNRKFRKYNFDIYNYTLGLLLNFVDFYFLRKLIKIIKLNLQYIFITLNPINILNYNFK